jgi:putative DNA primase/helicase
MLKNMFKLHIDPNANKSKPKNMASIKISVQRETPPVEITFNEIMDKISKGHTVSPAVMNGTEAKDWLQQQIFMIDIDNEADEQLAKKLKITVDDLPPEKRTPILPLNEALETCKQNNLPVSAYYHSFSHSEQRPKYRLIFITEEIITDTNIRYSIITSLISLFNQADKSCHNADRLFLGTNKQAVILDANARIKTDDVLLAYTPPVKPEQSKQPFKYFDNDLELLKQNFNFFEYLKYSNGEIYREDNTRVMFEKCEICGHHKDLVYYKNTNSFYCFGGGGSVGGSIIDYLIHTKNINVKEAVNHFKYEICGVERKKSTKQEQRDYAIRNKTQKNKKLIDKLIELQSHENYYWNDLGSSRLFAELFSNFYRYNYTASEWFIYDSKKWIEDIGSSRALKQFEKLYDALLNYATTIEDMNKKNGYFKYILNLGKATERKRILEDAENICAVFKDDFDKDNDLFNCQNGTLNLKTFDFKPHNSADLLTKISNVYYEPNAKSPLFEKFINEVMKNDKEKINYLQKALGYALTAETFYETCFILYGATTRNGKSTLMSTIMYMLGENGGYSLDMKPETLALKKINDSRQASGDIARLDGCRFLNASEPPKRMIFDVALLKNMLGRDPITARNIYEREFTFRPKFKLFINTNHLPLITDETLFKSGRINVITFDRHFTEAEQDKTLKDRLIAQENISGIFNFCMDGLKKFRSEGLEPPQAVREATDEYQRNSDKIGNFISECLEKTQGENCKAGDVYNIYQDWCESNGYGCENKSNFFDELKTKNIFANRGYVSEINCRNIVRGYKIINNK